MSRSFIRTLALLVSVIMLAGIFSVGGFAATKKYALGDVNMNDDVGPADARIALRMALLLDSFSVARFKLADVDRDNVLTVEDARQILRGSVGLGSIAGKTVSISDADRKTNAFTLPSEQTYVPSLPKKSTKHDTFTVTAYGYGHGVGLTQYGAVDMDKQGSTYREILAHYYKGTSVIKDPDYHKKTNYAGSSLNTEQLVARIVYGEIYGITNYGQYIEACKAQAVAVYTLLKYYDFNVASKSSVGYAASLDYASLPENLKDGVHEVIGRYICMDSDPDRKPILSVYSAAAAGKTCASRDIWGGDLSYLRPVESSWDLRYDAAVRTYELSSATVKEWIMAYDSSIVLGSDPATWFEVREHSGSIDVTRGYITSVRVGNKMLTGQQLSVGIFPYYRAGTTCLYIQYTP